MQSRTKIFSQLVRDYMGPARVVLDSGATVADLLGRMTAAKATSALVVDAQGALAGIITEQDVTRRIALRCDGSEPVTGVMTAPVRAIDADDYLYDAIARMRRFGWRHFPVTNAGGAPVGVIDLHSALAVAGEDVVRDIDRISHEGSLDGLREIKAAQVDLADGLFRDDVPVPEIQALITHINTDIHRRLIDGHLARMAQEGWGGAPVPFALIIMGSGGRGENFLYPDQDNGFILDDYPDSEHARIDSFFIELAERLTRDLDAVGFPFCNGFVMATNPVWRKTLSQWREQVSIWAKKRSAIAVQYSDIFFDFRGAHGVTAMADELRHVVTAAVRDSPAFLAEVYREIADHKVALGWFGRLAPEKDHLVHRGQINLKHRGTLPLVAYLRLMAMRNGIEATGTRARLDALYELGVLDTDAWDYLRGAFRHITGLLLRQQIADFKAGKEVNNFIWPEDLTERERDQLVDSFKAIDELRDQVKVEFAGDIF